jgi:soluble lytic murein transglycosylase
MRVLCLLLLMVLSSEAVSAEEGAGPPASSATTAAGEQGCETAESCFRNALAADAEAVSADERVARRLARLQRVVERYPASHWTRRATLAMGVLLIERQPAEALVHLRAAQPYFPILDDYLRLWIGEALLKSGDISAAASYLEITPTVVPDTLLGTLIAYRAGEAWFRVGQCAYASEPLAKAVTQDPQDPGAARAMLMLAECQGQDSRSPDSTVTLRQIWARYPKTPEADEAEKLLSQRLNDGRPWTPTPDERYARASALSLAALNEDAVEDFKAFLEAAPGHPKRDEARLRLAISLARLKRYDQAKQVFHAVASNGPSPEANEAAVWLARSYLRLGDGDRLVGLRQAYPKLTLTPEQQALILLMLGTWYDDQNQFDEAIAQYRQIAAFGDRTEQRAEALWRIGWIQYRTGRYREAVQTLEDLAAIREDPANNPQALYWTARSLERLQDARAAEVYQTLCRKYAWTYYCQLTRSRQDVPPPEFANGAADPEPADGGSDIAQDVHYRRAVELRMFGLEQETGREVAWLVDRYARNRGALVELITRVSEAGGYHQGLRLARLHFRDGLERGMEPVQPKLWSVAYPTVYLPTIRVFSTPRFDPYLAAAIIREESQYDARAVSRVGAIGLMQLMPSTAQGVAQRNGGAVSRDDLFDLETNIRYGVRYLEQLLGQFGDNLVHAVAAYNAGPPVVLSWVQKFLDKDPDEFVELIPYQETRQYVRRVLRSYREYRRLGGVPCAVRSLDKVC